MSEPVSSAQGADSPYVRTLRAGTRRAGHPTRDDIQLLSPDFYAAPLRGADAWMRAERADVLGRRHRHLGRRPPTTDVMRMSRGLARRSARAKGSRPGQLGAAHDQHGPAGAHARRRIVSAGFTRGRVQDHEPYLRRKVTKLIDAVAERGECDIVADIATPLPMYMIGELMGLPEADHAQLLHWSDLFATGGEEIRDEVVEAVRDYGTYILEQVAERRGGTAEDLVSLVVNADDEQGPLSDIDLVFETMLVLVGGDETTRHVISGGVEAAPAPPGPARSAAGRSGAAARARSRRCCAG